MNWREHLSASAQTLFIQQGDELRLLPRQLKIPVKILCFCITRWIKRGLELVLVPPILDLLAACSNGYVVASVDRFASRRKRTTVFRNEAA